MIVLLATSAELADGEPGAAALDAELASRGIEHAWVRWDDPAVDWIAASLVAVRSTWDYVARYAEFLAWARSLDQSRLLNGADVFDWNHDKAYLTDLGDLPVVPTTVAEDREGLAAVVRAYGSAVVKPRVGAGGEGLMVVTDPDDARLVDGAWVVQPVVESVRTTGEVSTYVLGGRVVSRFDKTPGESDVRVNEEFGGSVREAGPDAVAEVSDVVLRAYDAMTARFGRPMDYLRVDLLQWEDEWVVSELELIEPGLYLDVSPANAASFADVVSARLGAP